MGLAWIARAFIVRVTLVVDEKRILKQGFTQGCIVPCRDAFVYAYKDIICWKRSNYLLARRNGYCACCAI